MSKARLGCCVLGTRAIYETEGQCRVDSSVRAMGNSSIIDWRDDFDEAECMFLGMGQERGACVLDGGTPLDSSGHQTGQGCEFVTGDDCFSLGGDFNAGYLCSSPSLKTNCVMTKKTTCVDERDEVYSVDSCGNIANIYDSSRIDDVDYWDKVVEVEDLCDEGVKGNADSASCGNCNRFAGSICGSSIEDNFDVDIGDYYCRDLSCEFLGETYKDGESWCGYDGKIGDGDDVVGSRHWKYSCSQGKVNLEPECDDMRNEICIQSNTLDFIGREGITALVGNDSVEFRTASCVANNGRACLALNGNEGTMEEVMAECEDTLNCRIESVNIGSHFKFDVCLPKYPAGFDMRNKHYAKTAKVACGMADLTCTVVYEPKFFGGCGVAANGGCLTNKFAEEMNDFCRGLGDCGGSANIVGGYSDSYDVWGSGRLTQGWINKLKGLADPVEGQLAEVENYSEFLQKAGFWGGPGGVPEGDTADSGKLNNLAFGAVGAGLAAYAYMAYQLFGMTAVKTFFLGGETLHVGAGGKALVSRGSLTAIKGTPAVSTGAFANMAIGAGIGMVVGGMIANSMGLSEGGSMFMAIGGGIIGGAIGAVYIGLIATPVGWIVAAVGLVIMLIGSLFGGDDCPPRDVRFECKPWVPPTGGDDCEKCNEDPTKPCSEYRCHSLGAGCEIVNKGKSNEMCASSKDDGDAPVLEPQFDMISGGMEYADYEYGDGFGVVSEGGGCIDAYTNLVFGVSTDELAMCRYDVEAKEFDDMDFPLGGDYYSYDHTGVYHLLDPSGGESQGLDITGDVNLFVKCRDVFGHENYQFYEISACVNEAPDVLGPDIVGSNPANGGFVGFDDLEEGISIATSEPADCRWDFENVEYASMKNNMNCNDAYGSPSSILGYVCSDVLPTENIENVYYIRCLDQPWLGSDRNEMDGSYVYTLSKPDNKIAVDWVRPNEELSTVVGWMTVDFEIMTSGGGDWHHCSYSFLENGSFIDNLLQTGMERPHSWPLNLPVGSHEIYVECVDELGDSARGMTEFEILRSGIVVEVEGIDDFESGSEENVVELRVRTSGGGDEHSCSYSVGGGAWIEFDDQGDVGAHRQDVVVGVDDVAVRVGCWDEAGNRAEGSVSFNVEYDTSAPQIARVWQDGGNLYFVTIERVECRYSMVSCGFDWEDGDSAGTGEEHSIGVVLGKRYYIRCEDEFGTAPSGCSITAQAS